MLKKNGGITLIALVITIIVLLILAGVSIAMLSGDNGLLTRSSQAASKERIAGAKDTISTLVAAVGADWYEERYTGNATVAGSDIDAYIEDKLANSTDTKIKLPATIDGCTVDSSALSSGTIKVSYGSDNDKATAEGTLSKGSLTWKWVAAE